MTDVSQPGGSFDPRRSHRAEERALVPPGVEDPSEAAWRDYHASCVALDQQIARWRASAAVAARHVIARAAASSQLPQKPARRRLELPAPSGRRTAVTLDQVLQLTRTNARLCPLPGPWRCVYLLLPELREHGRVLRAPEPVPAHAWKQTPELRKQLTLRAQIDWAHRHGALTRLYDCLAALREQDWHHLPSLAWPELQRPRG
ncbi:hypothetical protein [Ramlibacter henchirensis]|uniref:hypothetical protein n=1 Tax=Ramlibacter henchirensis TaxID=204072 RepID=UPI0010766477|nr:hypothetical protein [Ramlibacter henchirensis]